MLSLTNIEKELTLKPKLKEIQPADEPRDYHSE